MKFTITWVERGEELSLTMTSRDGAFEMFADMKADDTVTAAEIECNGETLVAFDRTDYTCVSGEAL